MKQDGKECEPKYDPFAVNAERIPCKPAPKRPPDHLLPRVKGYTFRGEEGVYEVYRD